MKPLQGMLGLLASNAVTHKTGRGIRRKCCMCDAKTTCADEINSGRVMCNRNGTRSVWICQTCAALWPGMAYGEVQRRWEAQHYADRRKERERRQKASSVSGLPCP